MSRSARSARVLLVASLLLVDVVGLLLVWPGHHRIGFVIAGVTTAVGAVVNLVNGAAAMRRRRGRPSPKISVASITARERRAR